ncbi:MAG: hypothetical protein CVU58_03110 [Deltaproteobacteria bacterium HGW-Deltaproteobacteria-16]|nr:MAG: hypothetical protein CVU58_03110 [Deltaproteobacteria bacterium HGW-Deltaproteobacteria-16]
MFIFEPEFFNIRTVFLQGRRGGLVFFLSFRCSAACQWEVYPPPFVLPPSARGEESPRGQDWLGCLFLVSSFGHAQEERENSRKIISALSEISSKKKT